MSDQLLIEIRDELRRVSSLLEKQAHGGTPQLRTPKEAAILLGCTVQTLLQKIQAGEWPGHLIGTRYRVNVEAVQAAMQIHTRGDHGHG